MAKRIRIKQILELRDAHMSQNMIATSRKISKTSVGQVCRIADEKQIRFDDVRDMTEDEVYQLFFPDKSTDLSQMYDLQIMIMFTRNFIGGLIYWIGYKVKHRKSSV